MSQEYIHEELFGANPERQTWENTAPNESERRQIINDLKKMQRVFRSVRSWANELLYINDIRSVKWMGVALKIANKSADLREVYKYKYGGFKEINYKRQIPDWMKKAIEETTPMPTEEELKQFELLELSENMGPSRCIKQVFYDSIAPYK